MKYEEMNKSELLMEIARLQRRIQDYESKFGYLEEADEMPYLDIAMTKAEKLSVFMDYFAARPDVIDERYISKKDGKKHYSLGCINKFNRLAGCNIEQSHCKNCPAFSPRPYDTAAVEAHMNDDRHMIGVYPIWKDNTVRFLCFDLDESTYIEDAKRLRVTLFSLGVSPVLERSQSGHGIHVWIFFEEKIKAADARKIANYVLTEAMDRYGGFDFKSYDRVFPNQDKAPTDGYGNCVGLPLNKQCAEEGNTVFLDGEFQPIKNPIGYLSTITKISKAKAKELLEFAESRDDYGLFGDNALQKIAISADDFIGTLHLHYAGDIYIPLLELTSRATRFLARISSVLNKEYFKLLNARKSVYSVPKVLSCYKMDTRYFRLPRGYKEPLTRLLKSKGIPHEWTSALSKGEPIDVSFKMHLREGQVVLMEKAKAYDAAVIVAPTGFGKTVLGAAFIAHYRVSTLILVPSLSLLEQWVERLGQYLCPRYEYSKEPFGYLTGSGDKRNGKIDVATIQSLVRNDAFRKSAKNYGLVIVDEVHHMAAFKFEEALRELSPKYLYGLTATPERSDEREDFIFKTFGPMVQLDEKKELQGFIKYYHPRLTKFSSLLDASDINGLYAEVTKDAERNRLIVEDVTKTYREGGKCLVLTENIQHARILYHNLHQSVEDALILYGGQDKKERAANEASLASLQAKPFVVVSIGKYIGEGFDDDRFNALFITYPFRWKGILAQYCGRLQRKATAIKQVDVYDYVDPLVPAFSKMYRAREKGYFELGYKAIASEAVYQTDILDDEAFEKRFKEDLSSTKTSALLFMSFAHEDRLKRVLEQISCLKSVFVSGGMEIDVDVEIQRLDKPLPNMAILDNRVLYYGGINPFAYGQKDGTIMRMEDPSVVADVTSALLASKSG